jgi:hypothetical protein
MLHVQSNSLPICTRPRVLIKGSALDEGVPGRGGRDVRLVRHQRRLHAVRWRPIPVRVIARRPDMIVGFGETRIHAETATFELRASQVASPRSDDQLTVGGDTFIVQGRAGAARSRAARVEFGY